MPATLDDARLKLGQADQHLKLLKNEALAYTRSEPYDFIRKRDRDYARFVVEFTSQPRREISAVLGDFLHNLRSSVDYIMSACIVLNGGNLDERTLGFPIYGESAPYAKAR